MRLRTLNSRSDPGLEPLFHAPENCFKPRFVEIFSLEPLTGLAALAGQPSQTNGGSIAGIVYSVAHTDHTTRYTQAHRHLTGAEPSVELASLGRRSAEMELEMLDCIAAYEEEH